MYYMYHIYMKTLIVRQLNEGLHQKFKLHCVAQGKTMSEVIRDFMEDASAGTVVVNSNINHEPVILKSK